MTYYRCNDLTSIRNELRKGGGLLIVAMLSIVCPFGDAALAAPTVSSELFNQLKLLPHAEQQALARQYGIDPAILNDIDGVRGSIETEIGLPGKPVEPTRTAVMTNVIPTEEGDLKRYGAHLFDRDVSTFAPVDNLPVPEGYLMGPGDTLNVMLFGKEQLQEVLQIDREGTISFPRLGAISVAGLDFQGAKRLIERRIKQQMIGTEVIVSMGRLRSINVFFAGEVKTPGSYSISALATLTQALYVAGGITNIGSLRNIQVRRGGSIINTFDVYDLMLWGNVDADIRLQSGDVVFVPTVGDLVRVEGAVLRPREYELKDSRTLSEVLEMAGGVVSRGFTRIVNIERYTRGESIPRILTADLANREEANLELQDGDFVFVDRISEQLKNPVEFVGALARPSTYAWFEGARFSDYVTDVDADLLPNTDLDIGLIVRRKNQEMDIEVRSFDVLEAILDPGRANDPTIDAHDKVIIFGLPNLSQDETPEALNTEEDDESARILPSRTELLAPVIERLRDQADLQEMAETVGIGGAVRVPGEYPLLQGGSVDALIDLAGGLKDGAYVSSLEIRRIDSVPGQSASVKLINMSLPDLTRGDPGFELRSRDFVQVHQVSNWNPSDIISVEGEVIFPGEYLISPGETLGSVIIRAGGLTEDAFPEGAIFTRVSVQDAEKDRIQELSNAIFRNKASQLLTSEAGERSSPSFASESEMIDSTLMENLLSIETEGRLVIDLPAIVGGEIEEDFQIQNADRISIPLNTEVITVVGEVNRPGSFRYSPSLTFDDYIQLAAGRTVRSDKRSGYVIKANGLVERPRNRANVRWLQAASEQSSLEVGDTVVVPINQNYQRPLSKYREVSTVIFQGIVSLATLLAL